ncbi:hypothetical protein K450DRAFT_302214 [Umbelopsis ramanniana AG]|uniref:Uncharacterized protein n=1 Tax=Umbelopsis ramanniana AG TaxID=1314678 RepID=A0AAD5HCF1_UMBRA|nr:uncharacterized protein K450DRAFT_302214 [Umbelopsis ramanniana AG]KAI8577113.1 hypothetical protein K450DRAFT_302214 [Umbelopsis ramanniana AG]
MQDNFTQSMQGQFMANVSLQSLSLKSTKRRSYDPSLSRREQLYLGTPEQVPNQRKMRRSSSAQPLYPSMLSILEQDIQRPKSASRPLRTPSPSSSCNSDPVTGSLASIKSSTMSMFSTLQEALVRAEKAELQAKESQLKWCRTVTELDRLRDENLLVRNQFENSQAECHRLQDLLEQQSCQSTNSVAEAPSVSSSSSKMKYLLDKFSRKARSLSSNMVKRMLQFPVKF